MKSFSGGWVLFFLFAWGGRVLNKPRQLWSSILFPGGVRERWWHKENIQHFTFHLFYPICLKIKNAWGSKQFIGCNLMCSCAIKENLHEGLKNSKKLLSNGKGWINLCVSVSLRERVANQWPLLLPRGGNTLLSIFILSHRSVQHLSYTLILQKLSEPE